AVRDIGGWKLFLALGVPGAVMVASEWWAYELTSLLSGHLGPHALAAHSVLTTTGSLTYMLPLGVAVAATNRIGNALGRGDPRGARLAAIVGVLVGGALGILNGTWLVAVREWWGGVFVGDGSGDEEHNHSVTESKVDQDRKPITAEQSDATLVTSTVSSTLPLLSVFQLSDGLACVSGGCMRGAGYQKVGAVFNAIAYYGVGLPTAVGAALWRSKSVEMEEREREERNNGEIDLQESPATLSTSLQPADSYADPPKPLSIAAQRAGLQGIWIGMCAGFLIMSVMQVRFVLRLDWRREVERARRRVQGG
ncbi:hypothetical protein HDU93_000913, partial [Gonapodya sp. JEL0774]